MIRCENDNEGQRKINKANKGMQRVKKEQNTSRTIFREKKIGDIGTHILGLVGHISKLKSCEMAYHFHYSSDLYIHTSYNFNSNNNRKIISAAAVAAKCEIPGPQSVNLHSKCRRGRHGGCGQLRVQVRRLLASVSYYPFQARQ